MDERERKITPEHEYEEHMYDKTGAKSKIQNDRRGEKSKDEYLKKKTMEMLNHHGQYETENTEDWVTTKTHQKQHKFPEDNLMGYCDLGNLHLEPKTSNKQYKFQGDNFMKSGDLENLPQDPQCRDTENYPETEEDTTIKAEGVNQIKERIIHNSRFTKKFQAQRKIKPDRDYTIENQRQPNFARPPPNLEKNKYH